ncbi:MAG TPA: c-type cytochrome [bacterium]|nr:c-type cytochrome [bacterium]
MKKLLITALALSVLCVALAAPAFADEAKKEEAKMPAGQKVFMDAKCQMCHTVYSAAIGEPPAEDAEKKEDASGPPDLSMTGADKTAEWMSLFLQKKEALNDKKHMKRFKGSDEDLTALVDWLMTLKPVEKEAPKAEKVEEAAKADEAAAEKASGCGHDHGDHDKAESDKTDEDSHEGHDHGDHDEDGDAEAEKGE